MTAPSQLQRFERPSDRPGPGRVLVRVAGCGVCHTDLGFLYGGVPTKRSPPLVLGHEISGVVEEVGEGAEAWRGARVVVPAVLPCGTCAACRRGRSTACRSSTFLGSDVDGGWASHVEVAAGPLCRVDAEPASAPVGSAKLELWELAVVADAIATPCQAITRSGIGQGDFAVVVGAGGLGTFAVQLARAAGATVAALDVDPRKLERAEKYGAAMTLSAKQPAKAVKGALADFARSKGLGKEFWFVFETSGSVPGQELAWSLLTPGGTIAVVGYTPEPASVRVSNLMAFDATAFGVWGCGPELYPQAVESVASGAVKVRGLVRREPLEEAGRIVEAVHRGEIQERVVLTP